MQSVESGRVTLTRIAEIGRNGKLVLGAEQQYDLFQPRLSKLNFEGQKRINEVTFPLVNKCDLSESL